MSNRFLIFISLALLVIALLECFYIFIYKSRLNKSQYLTNNTYVTEDNVGTRSAVQVNGGIFNYLKSYDSKILTSSNVTSELSGRIVQVLDKPGIQGQAKYEKGLILTDEESGRVKNYFLIRLADIPKMSIYDDIDGIKSRIDFKELKASDSIVIYEKVDMLAPRAESRTSIEIVRI